MNSKRILASAISGLIILTSLSGCSRDTDWAFKAGDNNVSSGQYIYILTKKTETARTKLNISISSDDNTNPTKELFDKQIDGKSTNDWIKDEAIARAKELLGARIEFKNLGLSFSDEENTKNSKITQEYNSYNSYQHYGEVGIGESSFKTQKEDEQKYDKVYDAYYGTNGKEPLTDQQKDEYTKTFGANYKSITITKEDDKSSSSKSEDQKSVSEQIEEYKKEIQNGKNIDEINTIYQKSKGNDNPSELTNSFLFEKDETKNIDILDAVFKMATVDGAPIIKETDKNYLIIQRFTPDQETCEKQREDATDYVKQDELREKLNKITDENNFETNNSAISKYTPKKQKSRQNKAENDASSEESSN